MGVLRAFDADVIVLQESWTPDEGGSAVDKAAAELGAEVHELPTGRAVRQPWPHIARSGAERGTVGVAVVTRFPAEQLLVAGTRYQTAGGPLPATRETQSNLNRAASSTLEAVVTSARQEGSRVRT